MPKSKLKRSGKFKVKNKDGTNSIFTITKCNLTNTEAKKEAKSQRKKTGKRHVIKEGDNGYCVGKGPKSKVKSKKKKRTKKRRTKR